MKVDVAIQSYKKPESLVYTLLSLKKYCGHHIDCIYINDDCSFDNSKEIVMNNKLIDIMNPIKIKFRENKKPSGYSVTLLTKKLFNKKNIIQKVQILLAKFIKRFRFIEDENDIRYQWAINNTNKKYIFIIHDDIKFYDDILGLYIDTISSNKNMAIVGDLGGSKRCPFGPCGENNCSAEKIVNGYRPNKNYPITGTYNLFYSILGRKKRNCRINEWCCLVDVNIAEKIKEKYGSCFGNYEFGGDVACYWFDLIIREGFNFTDPLPCLNSREKFYKHWWQGYEGHSVLVAKKNEQKSIYEREMIKMCLKNEFNYEIDGGD